MKNFFGLVKMTFGLVDVARRASCKINFLCTLIGRWGVRTVYSFLNKKHTEIIWFTNHEIHSDYGFLARQLVLFATIWPHSALPQITPPYDLLAKVPWFNGLLLFLMNFSAAWKEKKNEVRIKSCFLNSSRPGGVMNSPIAPIGIMRRMILAIVTSQEIYPGNFKWFHRAKLFHGVKG